MADLEVVVTFAEFAAINRARCEHPDGFAHTLDSWSLSDWIVAVTGELGEAANIAKKLNRVRDGIPGNDRSEAELRDSFREEIADAFIYLDLIAQSQGFRLVDAVLEKFDKTSLKIGYPILMKLCEHGIDDMDWCPRCNAEYKRARVENGDGGDEV